MNKEYLGKSIYYIDEFAFSIMYDCKTRIGRYLTVPIVLSVIIPTSIIASIFDLDDYIIADNEDLDDANLHHDY